MIATTTVVDRICFISVPQWRCRAAQLHSGHTGHRVTDSRRVGHYNAQVDRAIVIGLGVDHLLVEDQSQAGDPRRHDEGNTLSDGFGHINGTGCNFLLKRGNFLGDHGDSVVVELANAVVEHFFCVGAFRVV